MLMRQYELNSICDILYKIRDNVNTGRLEMALVMVRELYETLVIKVHNKEKSGCKLDCEVKDET
jgi:hypothetical protein